MINKQKILEGIHLIAYVRDKQTKLYSAIEDSSYNTKASFKKDLEANGYDNISILDNRDMFLIDNTNYMRVSQLKNELKKLRDDMKIYSKDKYPTIYKDMLDKYNKLKEVYDKVMKIPLTEGYVLKGIQDGKSFDISYNDSEEKLQKFKDEMQPKHQDIDMFIVEESLNKYNMLIKQKLEEVSRNELLAKTKGETITRYKKSAQYKGFNLVDIDINNLLRDNTIVLVCRVGDYLDYIQLEDVLYWIQIVAEKSANRQINNKVVTEALMNAIDGMDIKVDCECGDWRFRLKYQATEWGYNYGRPETRPANIRNPNGFGALCKHLTAVLSNKKWLQQVASFLMDWCSKNIEQINNFLKLTDENKQLTLPNELARQNAKKGFYTKLFKDVDNNETDDVPNEENPQETSDEENNQNDIENTNNNDDTDDTSSDIELQDINDTDEDEENNE